MGPLLHQFMMLMRFGCFVSQVQGRSAAYAEAMQKETEAMRLHSKELETKLEDSEARLGSEIKSRIDAEEALSAIKVRKCFPNQ